MVSISMLHVAFTYNVRGNECSMRFCREWGYSTLCAAEFTGLNSSRTSITLLDKSLVRVYIFIFLFVGGGPKFSERVHILQKKNSRRSLVWGNHFGGFIFTITEPPSKVHRGILAPCGAPLGELGILQWYMQLKLTCMTFWRASVWCATSHIYLEWILAEDEKIIIKCGIT